jgi:hypothetical protein
MSWMLALLATTVLS